MEVGGHFAGTIALLLRERASDVHSIIDAVDLRASLDASKKENISLRSRIKSDPSFAYISGITGR